MKTDRSGRTFEEYRQLFWDEQKRVKELDGFITEYQKRELNFLERIAALVDERVDFCAALSGQTDRAVVAEATIKGVRECKQYVAELPEIGKLAPVLRWRDVLQALGEAK